MDMRNLIAAAVVASMTGLAFGQTQPTPPSAYATFPTMRSAWATAPLSPCYGWSRGHHFASFHDSPHNGSRHRWSSFNPTSPCYTGTPYLNYSAIEPFEFSKPTNRLTSPGSASLDEDQAKKQIEAKGYLDVSGMKEGRRGAGILDFEGNIKSEWRKRLIHLNLSPSR